MTKKENIPNLLTVIRIFMIPPVFATNLFF